MTVAGARAALAVAVDVGHPDLIRAFAETGRDGLVALREELPEAGRTWVVGTNRDRMDNLGAAVAAIAAQWPDEYLEVFADTSRDDGPDTYVLEGLGAIHDARATERLLAATSASHPEGRRAAALYLTGRKSRAISEALVRLLADPDAAGEALWALAKSGDETALPALRSFTSDNRLRTELAEFAAAEIEARAGRHRQATGSMRPWKPPRQAPR